MTAFAAARFPSLAPQPPTPRALRHLGLPMGLIPLPIGEFSVLLTAWLLILPV
jgi:hypothetical protein